MTSYQTSCRRFTDLGLETPLTFTEIEVGNLMLL